MITFIHTADFHFGVENYGKIDAQTGMHTRLLDFRDSLSTCVTQAIHDQVDFFLFCGDAYKTAIPNPTQQKTLVTQLLRLHAAHIPVVIIVGNHDHPLSFGKSHSLDVFDYLPVDGFHVIARPEVVTLETPHGPINIVGIPWPTRNYVISNEQHRFKNNTEIATYLSEKVGAIIDGLASKLDPHIPAILAAHLTVSTGIFSGSEKCAIFGTDPIFLPSQLIRPQFDYVALGHLHRYQNLNPNGYPAVVYSGSLERVDFGERKETKGYCKVVINASRGVEKPFDTLAKGSHSGRSLDTFCCAKHSGRAGEGIPLMVSDCHLGNRIEPCSHEFIPLPTRPMIQIDVHLEPNKDYTHQILDKISQHDLTQAIVKITYHVPESSLHHKIDLYAIGRACSAAHFIVGIFPVYRPEVRDRRACLSVQMDLNTLLDKYLDAKEIPTVKKVRVLQKARDLEHMKENNVDI